jgi:hypothetical protein
LDGDEKDKDDYSEHAEGCFLALPGFGLPHEEPLGADGEERDEPHQETQGKRSDGDILGAMKVGRGAREAHGSDANHPTSIRAL